MFPHQASEVTLTTVPARITEKGENKSLCIYYIGLGLINVQNSELKQMTIQAILREMILANIFNHPSTYILVRYTAY